MVSKRGYPDLGHQLPMAIKDSPYLLLELFSLNEYGNCWCCRILHILLSSLQMYMTGIRCNKFSFTPDIVSKKNCTHCIDNMGFLAPYTVINLQTSYPIWQMSVSSSCSEEWALIGMSAIRCIPEQLWGITCSKHCEAFIQIWWVLDSN